MMAIQSAQREPSPVLASGRLLWIATAALLGVVFSNGAIAADGEEFPGNKVLTVYAGFRDGGSFEDIVTGRSVSLESSETYAASLDFPLDETRQFQVFCSFQDTRLGLDAFATGSSIVPEFPMQVMYLQLGGTSFVGDEIGKGVYVVGGVGATLFDPTSPGYESEMRFSINVGLGYEQPLSKRMALRFEARGYFTLINSSSAMFCSGGCTIAISGESVTQAEVSVGLAFGL